MSYYIKSLVGNKSCLALVAGFALSRNFLPQEAPEFRECNVEMHHFAIVK